MKKQKFYTPIVMILFAFLMLMNVFPIITLGQLLETSGSTPMENVVIDGVINEAEWADKDWKIGFYLDIDEVFNPPDTDGWNYLYLGEDVSNLYIGLDLCSDQTADLTDEWIGVWLNINNRSFDSLTTWANYQQELEEITAGRDVQKLLRLADRSAADYIIVSNSFPKVTGWVPVMHH